MPTTSQAEQMELPLGKLIQPERLTTFQPRQYAGIEPQTLKAILTRLEEGRDLEDWADLASFMLRTDAHLRATYDTLVTGSLGRKSQLEPPPEAPDESLADEGAALAREALAQANDTEVYSHLNHALGIGWAAAEHQVERRAGLWVSHPQLVQPRDVALDTDWSVVLRTWTEHGSWHWIRTADHPGRFIVHSPSLVGGSPAMRGVLVSVAWPWLFKRWSRLWQQDGLERMGNPFIIGTILENAPEEVRKTFHESLQSLSGDHVAVAEKGTEINVVEPSSEVGKSFGEVITDLDEEVTKGILGSTLNTEVGDTGGAYQAAVSQGDYTLLPRFQRAANLLARTIERDWLAPLMVWNARRFGGRIPPTPRLQFTLEQDESVEVEDWMAPLGVVTVDELRQAKGLDPWGPERGGDEKVSQPAARTPNVNLPFAEERQSSDDGKAIMELAKSVSALAERVAGAIDSGEQVELAEEDDPGPFVRPRTQSQSRYRKNRSRWTKPQWTPPQTSPTSSDLSHPIGDVLSGSSDDPET